MAQRLAARSADAAAPDMSRGAETRCRMNAHVAAATAEARAAAAFCSALGGPLAGAAFSSTSATASATGASMPATAARRAARERSADSTSARTSTASPPMPAFLTTSAATASWFTTSFLAASPAPVPAPAPNASSGLASPAAPACSLNSLRTTTLCVPGSPRTVEYEGRASMASYHAARRGRPGCARKSKPRKAGRLAAKRSSDGAIMRSASEGAAPPRKGPP
mmetsp:Transcript_11589/g.28123  ORF Transcript_11589/g.28123 Transcript_11589/m.28123 type:complete len:223 (-) Transcript_11589:857-1525(-)